MQEIDEIDSVVKDGRGVVGTCDPRKYAESRRVAQVFQELSDKVSGVNVPTVKKRRRMTGRFPRQEDLEGKTASPLRQSSDLKAKGCRFVGRVVSPSACVPQPSPVAQEDFCATTQDIKQESLEKKQESLEKNGKTKAPRTSKNSGDGASKSMHKAGRRKRKRF
uniref:Uncharacterized protein n=1 Tax=Strongyloides papillosus TaxID=174720 RepID=A0A0N5C1P7_STREA